MTDKCSDGLKPVRRYPGPCIPRRDEVNRSPELLRSIPRRWQGNALVVSTLTAALALSAASRGESGQPSTSRIAPVFEHGDGHAAFGGVGQRSPTVFISEPEARQIIMEEAMRAGVQFDLDRNTLRSINRPVTDSFAFVRKENQGKGREAESGTQTVRVPLGLDGSDTKRGISFEYVSQEDFNQWEIKDDTMFCTVSDIDIGMTAQKLRKALIRAKPRGVYAVFYDPVVTAPEPRPGAAVSSQADSKARWEAAEKGATAVAREELRKQVQDFVKWLKARG